MRIIAVSDLQVRQPDPTPSPPSEVASWMPPRLRELLLAHGEGRLAAQLDLAVPGGERHRGIEARFVAAASEPRAIGWGWIRQAALGAVPIGELAGGRGFLVCLPAASAEGPLLWLCHRWGGVYPVGDDLEAVASALVEGMVLEIELVASEAPGSIVDLTSTFSLEATYDTRPAAGESELRAALEGGEEAAIDAAFEAFMASGIAPERLGDAARLGEQIGEAASGILDTIAMIRRRNPELAKLETRLRADSSALAAFQGFLAEVGAQGSALPTERMLRVASALRPSPRFVRAAVGALQRARLVLSPPVLQGLLDGLAACSPEDIAAVGRIVSAPMGMPTRPWFAAPRFDPSGRDVVGQDVVGQDEVAGNDRMPWKGIESNVSPVERLWAIGALLLFASHDEAGHDIALRAIGQARDGRLVAILDVFLARTHPTWNNSGAMAAKLRAAIRPLGEGDLGWLSEAFAERGPVPSAYREYQVEGLMTLLAESTHLDGAMDLARDNVTRNPYVALEAARRRGNDPKAHEVLAQIWGQAKRFPVTVARDACKLAAEWKVPAAQKALATLEGAAQREGRRLEQM